MAGELFPGSINPVKYVNANSFIFFPYRLNPIAFPSPPYRRTTRCSSLFFSPYLCYHSPSQQKGDQDWIQQVGKMKHWFIRLLLATSLLLATVSSTHFFTQLSGPFTAASPHCVPSKSLLSAVDNDAPRSGGLKWAQKPSLCTRHLNQSFWAASPCALLYWNSRWQFLRFIRPLHSCFYSSVVFTNLIRGGPCY